jgi:hypothetical protein
LNYSSKIQSILSNQKTLLLVLLKSADLVATVSSTMFFGLADFWSSACDDDDTNLIASSTTLALAGLD